MEEKTEDKLNIRNVTKWFGIATILGLAAFGLFVIFAIWAIGKVMI